MTQKLSAAVYQITLTVYYEPNMSLILISNSANSFSCEVMCYDQFESCDHQMFLFLSDLMVIIGGILQQNPFYVQPDEFLKELQSRKVN